MKQKIAVKKETSIEWLMTQLYKKGFIKEVDGNEPIHLMNQAKAMEKEQIEDAYWDGGQDVPTHGRQCEQYYNETYGK